MDLSHKIIIVLLIILILLTVYKKQENAGSTTGSAANSIEAVANIAKVYADSAGIATFNNVRITGNLDATNFKGIICAWSGTIENIPSGWALCDGQNGRPDLRGRFILGYNQPSNGPYLGSSYDGEVTKITQPGVPGGAQVGGNLAGVIGSVGGEIMHTLTPSEIPPHKHAASKSCMGSDPAGDASTYTDLRSTHGWNCADRSGNPIFTNWGNDTNTGNPLGGKYHNILPPFYVLAYIIKI